MSHNAVEVTGLSVTYGGAHAVDDVSFSVAPGQCLTILGPNGAGKSSIAKALAGLIKPTAGSVLVCGLDTRQRRAHELARKKVAYLPEGRGIFPTLSVLENLILGLRVLPRAQQDAAAQAAYGLFPVLEQRRNKVAATLSGGEQQMLAVARAVVTRPELLVADEISLGLAPLVIDDIYAALATVRENGTTVVLIEQYVERALKFADRALVLQRGRVRWSGPASDGAAEHVAHGYLGTEAVEV